MRTYSIVRPEATHRRPVSCAEFNCDAWSNGWAKAVLPDWSANGYTAADQADYIRTQSGRRYTETVQADGVIVFTFPPGQECFTRHTMPVERPALYVRSDGTPGQLTNRYRHDTPEHWAEDFADNQDRLSQLIN
jgi:hypothetical protein